MLLIHTVRRASANLPTSIFLHTYTLAMSMCKLGSGQNINAELSQNNFANNVKYFLLLLDIDNMQIIN